jgi:hypothetical protein
MNWFRNTLRRAYLDWQALEDKRDAARQELDRHYLALRQMAEDLQTEPSQGIIAAARLMLEQPFDPAALKQHRRLKQAFQVLGKGSCRRAPASLQLEILQYGSRIEEICQQYDGLSARLQLAQEIIGVLRRVPAEPAAATLFRLAITAPEAASVLFFLRQRRLANRQARLDSLTRSLQARAAACRRWVELLQDSLSARTCKQCKKSLKSLLDKAVAQRGRGAVPELVLSHRKLDSLTDLMNRRAGQRMAADSYALLKTP